MDSLKLSLWCGGKPNILKLRAMCDVRSAAKTRAAPGQALSV